MSEDRCSSILDDVIQTTEELSALEVDNEHGLTSKIRTSGITLWNRAVSLKMQEHSNTHLIARSQLVTRTDMCLFGGNTVICF